MREGGGLLAYLGIKSKVLPQPTFDEKDKYKLSNRILTYQFIKSYLDSNLNPNDCLTAKQFGDKTGYTIRSIIYFYEIMYNRPYILILSTCRVNEYIIENTQGSEAGKKRVLCENPNAKASRSILLVYGYFCSDVL